MTDVIQWTATISGVIAAILVAGRFSSRLTGWGFVIFAVSSVGWIAFGLLKKEAPLTLQNAVLFLINVFGVWRYLIAKGEPT